MISKFIFHGLLKWNIQNSIDFRKIKKAVIIVVPHTSWHDFYIGLLVRNIVRIKGNFVGKKELFRWPYGWIFRWLGGIALDREKNENKVEQIAGIYKSRDEFLLAIAPEGTRKKVTEWKSGFYYIAHTAGVPIIPVSFDFGTKTVRIGNAFHTTGDYNKDLVVIRAFYKGVTGKIPEYT